MVGRGRLFAKVRGQAEKEQEKEKDKSPEAASPDFTGTPGVAARGAAQVRLFLPGSRPAEIAWQVRRGVRTAAALPGHLPRGSVRAIRTGAILPVPEAARAGLACPGTGSEVRTRQLLVLPRPGEPLCAARQARQSHRPAGRHVRPLYRQARPALRPAHPLQPAGRLRPGHRCARPLGATHRQERAAHHGEVPHLPPDGECGKRLPRDGKPGGGIPHGTELQGHVGRCVPAERQEGRSLRHLPRRACPRTGQRHGNVFAGILLRGNRAAGTLPQAAGLPVGEPQGGFLHQGRHHAPAHCAKRA